MTQLVLRDPHRTVVRPLDRSITLGELSVDSVIPYEPDWLLVPEGDFVVLLRPDGERMAEIPCGAQFTVGDRTFTIEKCERGSFPRERESSRRTERLMTESRVPLALVLPGGRRIVPGTREITVGTDRGCTVVLSDNAVSARHCRVVPVPQGWELRDEGSTNGTWVDGALIRAVTLREGASITVGRSRILCIGIDRDEERRSSYRKSEYPLVGGSMAMTHVREQIERFAASPYPVLILGETGSGKELAARMLHERSPRAKGPFVALNAGAIPRDLVESELFGHEKGAFTGAATRRRGVFEEANDGTLFLDEIGELPMEMQSRLLRVLETREIRRVGGEGAVSVNVRIVCATHRNLAMQVEKELFRQDLMFRLDLLRVEIPPLRDRMEDLPSIAQCLIARISDEVRRRYTLEPASVARLLRHHWPGNVRELYGVLCRAAVDARSERVGPEHITLPNGTPVARESKPFRVTSRLPPRGTGVSDVHVPAAPRVPQIATSLRDGDDVPVGGGSHEALLFGCAMAVSEQTPPARVLAAGELQALLQSCEGNVSRAAMAAGIPRTTFRERVRRCNAR